MTESVLHKDILAKRDTTIQYRRAHFALQLFLTIMLIGAVIGGTWDKLYHVTEPFEDFFSAPHLFIYTCSTIASFIVMYMLFSDAIRPAFGKGFNVRILPFKVPGALFILGGGIAMLGFAGLVLDNFWHSNFGLNETSLSLPHSMLGWMLVTIVLGYISCRLALRVNKPLRWYTVLLMGYLLMSIISGPLTLTLMNQRTPETLQFVAQLPALAVQEEFQHTVRIAEAWSLDRTNPLLLILAPLWLGASVAFIRKLDKRWWILLLITLLVWGGDSNQDFAETLSRYIPSMLENEANWRAMPIFLPVLVMAILHWVKVSDKRAWGTASIVFALLIYGIWGTNPLALLLIPFAPLTMWFGKWLGEKAFNIVEKPYSFAQVRPLVLFVILFPVFTGVLDLIMRLTTP